MSRKSKFSTKIPDIEDVGSLLAPKMVVEELSMESTSSEDVENSKLNLNSKKDPTTDVVGILKDKNCSWVPQNWEKILQNIRLMRSCVDAPVDTMGCQKCADENADEKTQRYQTLVALMLSSQTKDEVTYSAMSRLKEQGLTAKAISRMSMPELENIIYPVSFYKNKAKYLHKTAKILLEKYDGDIPDNVKDLIALPGVGPKMAHLCMAIAWNSVSGIGVDLHVHRISNRLGLVESPTKETEQTRLALEKWLPRELWSEINKLLVGFGQTICYSFHPKCNECLNNSICPFVTQKKKQGSKLTLNEFENSEIKKPKVKRFQSKTSSSKMK